MFHRRERLDGMTIETRKKLIQDHFRTFNEGDIDRFAATAQ